MNNICNIYNDKEYMSIVGDILDNSKFKKIDNCIHHGLSRFDHSLRVSYYSYKFARKHNLDYVAVARAGLMHDFFIADDLTDYQKKISAFVHHNIALNNACKYFNLTKKEKNIIVSHMFPLVLFKIPMYIESYVVSIVDKIVATYEFSLTKPIVIKRKFGTFSTSVFLFMIFCCRFNAL